MSFFDFPFQRPSPVRRCVPFACVYLVFICASADIIPVQVTGNDGGRLSAAEVIFDGEHFLLKGGTDGAETRMQAGSVSELLFLSALDLEAPLHRFAAEDWARPRGRTDVDADTLRVFGGTGIAHPLPEDLPQRFLLDFVMDAPEDGLSGFQWRVFESEPGELSVNSFTIAIFGEALRLQAAGVQTQPARLPRTERRLPASDTYRLQLFHDQDTGENVLLVNGTRMMSWTLAGDRALDYTGIRYEWGNADWPPLTLRAFTVRNWPHSAPETVQFPDEAETDLLLLQNGDILAGEIMEIGTTVLLRPGGQGDGISIPLERVYRIRFEEK